MRLRYLFANKPTIFYDAISGEEIEKTGEVYHSGIVDAIEDRGGYLAVYIAF